MKMLIKMQHIQVMIQISDWFTGYIAIWKKARGGYRCLKTHILLCI